MVDRIVSTGLRLARLSDETRAGLLGMLLPPQADNPVDLGGRLPGQADDISAAALSTLAADPDVSVLLLYLTSMPFFEERTRVLAETALATGKLTVAFVLPGPAGDRPRRVLRELGVPCFDSSEDLLLALRGVLAHHPMVAEIEGPPMRPADVPATLPVFTTDAAGLEKLVSAYGIRFPAARECADLATAVGEATSIGFPIVLKGIASGVTHKTDMGLVKTGIADPASLAVAWRAIETALATHGLADRFAGCLVQQQIPPGLELITAHSPRSAVRRAGARWRRRHSGRTAEGRRRCDGAPVAGCRASAADVVALSGTVRQRGVGPRRAISTRRRGLWPGCPGSPGSGFADGGS